MYEKSDRDINILPVLLCCLYVCSAKHIYMSDGNTNVTLGHRKTYTDCGTPPPITPPVLLAATAQQAVIDAMGLLGGSRYSCRWVVVVGWRFHLLF